CLLCFGLAIDPAPAADDAFDMLGGAGLPDREQSIAPRLDDFRRDAIVRRWGAQRRALVGDCRLDGVSDEPFRMLGPTTIRFCPLCAGALGRGPVPPDQREQAVCGACGFVFYLNPKVVAGTIPEQEGRILLTRRSINPGRGL